MVVTYKPFVQRPNKQYTGILLVGNSVNIFDKKLRGALDTNYQNIGEEMLKYSEPAVHDDWNGKNFQAIANSKENLKIVANAGKIKITEFITKVRNTIRIALGDVEPPKASKDANWAELSKALEFGRSNSDSGGRIISITRTNFKRTYPAKGLLSFNLVVPNRSDKQWSKDVTQWKLELKAKVMFADGKTKTIDLTCWKFDKLLDDANHAAMTSHVKMNYNATKAPWKKMTSKNSLDLKVNEWIGERNKLTAPILLKKVLKISFKNLKIDLTGYETAQVELIIETNEVKL